jgi:hypothetical protein
VRPDPKPSRRVRDAALVANLHRLVRECFLCGAINVRLSAHHVHKHPRSDVPGNLTMLCGDGVAGCHGDVEHARGDARARLVREIRVRRPDVFEYLTSVLGSTIAADEWLRSYAEGKTR